MATHALTTSTAAHNVAGPIHTDTTAVAACLRALSARWPGATFDIDRRDDGAAYGQFWSPAPANYDTQLSVIVERTGSGEWSCAATMSGAPVLATGSSMAECLRAFAQLLRVATVGLVFGAHGAAN